MYEQYGICYNMIQVLIAVGGWIVGSEPFSKIVVDEKSRKTFSRNAVRFLRQQVH